MVNTRVGTKKSNIVELLVYELVNDGRSFAESSFLTESNILLAQGAESRVFEGSFCGRNAVFKERFQKRYRLQQLDEQLTKDRIKNEARSLFRCQAAGVLVPALYHVDVHSRQLITEKIRGPTLKEVLCDLEKQNDLHTIHKLLNQVGQILAQLHKNNIIHGDPTTSNIIVSDKGLVLIDFGLSSISEKNEEKAVDVYVLERAIESTHPSLENKFSTVIKSYCNLLGKKSGAIILSKYNEVKLRGRKRTMEG